MHGYETIILILTVYTIIGAMSTLCAALADSHWKMLLFSFFCWPVIAYYGLLMLVERMKIDFRK